MKMNYSYILHTPEKLIKIDENIALFEEKGENNYDIAPFSVYKKVSENGIYRIIELTVSSENEAEVYLSLMDAKLSILSRKQNCFSFFRTSCLGELYFYHYLRTRVYRGDRRDLCRHIIRRRT